MEIEEHSEIVPVKVIVIFCGRVDVRIVLKTQSPKQGRGVYQLLTLVKKYYQWSLIRVPLPEPDIISQ